MAALLSDVGELRSAGALWLAPRRPVLAIGLTATAGLLSLHADLAAALAGGVGFEPERRPFVPHVTVGRRERRGARIATRALDPPVLAFAPAGLTLYRSHGRRRCALRAARRAPPLAAEVVHDGDRVTGARRPHRAVAPAAQEVRAVSGGVHP